MRNQLSHHEHSYERKQELNLLSYDISVVIRNAMQEQQVRNRHILAAVAPKFGLKPASAGVYLSKLINGDLILPYRIGDDQLNVEIGRIQAVFDYLNISFDDALVKRIRQYAQRFKPISLRDKNLENVLASSLPTKIGQLREEDRENIEKLVDNYLRKNPPKRIKKVQSTVSRQAEQSHRSAAR